MDNITRPLPFVEVLHGECHCVTDNPTSEFPFTLDHFQRHCQRCISKDEDVLVLAHTGSGKTVVAEIAIDHNLSKNKRVIYTSPIKALSNQKYQDFKLKYGSDTVSVGIMTGDNKIEPNADIVVMTTEILCNALYNVGSQDQKKEVLFDENFLDNIGCVVFDEVHYINDTHRGHVWEETLIMLNRDITLVMLSATISRAEEFASWLGTNRQKTVHMTPTSHRVVPLKHFVYLDNKLHLIQDDRDVFQNENFDKVCRLNQQYVKSRKKPGTKYLINELVGFLKERKLLQTIVFAFSRKRCEVYAKQITVPLVDHLERAEIDRLFSLHMHKYEKIYKSTEQYHTIKDLVGKGVAFHHSGLLPVMKEIVEIIFQKGLIKVLFATETFAVGVNMPTRTVVFTEINKMSDNGRRLLQTAEYKQMSGRAGRRGLDTTGNVILLPMYGMPSRTEIRSVMLGQLPHITSKFEVTYSFLLKTEQSASQKIDNFVEQSMFHQDNQVLIKNTSAGVAELQEKFDVLDKQMSSSITDDDMKLVDRLTELEEKAKELQKSGIGLNKKQVKEMNRLKKATKDCNADIYPEWLEIKTRLDKDKHLVKSASERVEMEQSRLVNVLYLTGYVTENVGRFTKDQLTSKAVVAAQINDCNPLILTEMIVNNMFLGLTAAEVCAVLAVFVTDVRSDQPKSLGVWKPPTDAVKKTLEKINETVKRFTDAEDASGVDLHLHGYYDICYEYVDAAFMWASGESFGEVNKLLDTYEGNFIRSVLKINTLAQDVASLSRVHGLLEVLPVLEEVTDLLVRDLVTVGSLYL